MKWKGLIQLSDISSYRSELMGWSILWIMMLHFGFYRVIPLGFIAQYGYAGVDVFMFVSGFGIFFSLQKKPSLPEFYFRRVTRIFPSYYIIGLLASLLIFHDTISQYLFRYSTMGFWIGSDLYGDWYVPSIVLLYIVSPVFRKMGVRGQSLLILFFLCLSYFLVELYDFINTEHYFFIYRIPAFLYGMICAHWLQSKCGMKWYYAVLLCGVPLFMFLYPMFHEIYRYKYYSVLFLMPVFVCAMILISKYLKMFSLLIRRMGQASLEIYLTQGLFFNLIIKDSLSRSDFTTFSLILLCSVSGCILHMAINGKRLFYIPALIIYLFIATSIWYIEKWQPLITPTKSQPAYRVLHHKDDTLRIAMYGDSWVGLHPRKLDNTVIQGHPVLFQKCGKGGLKSGEIYQLMFAHRQFLENGPDYCVVIAGINDANTQVGEKCYVMNYQLILSHLLSNGIRPVVIEIPDVDLGYVYAKKPLKDCLSDAFRAFITASDLYEVSGYRTSLCRYLEDRHLMDSILYITSDSWNPGGYKNSSMYLDDRIHLNIEGYRKLDSCIVSEIERDMLGS